jgi:hypothetical protein
MHEFKTGMKARRQASSQTGVHMMNAFYTNYVQEIEQKTLG